MVQMIFMILDTEPCLHICEFRYLEEVKWKESLKFIL